MKKIIIIASGILIFILIILLALSRRGQSPNTKNTTSISPTNIEASQQKNLINDKKLLDKARTLSPYETDSFKYSYSLNDNKIVVEEKSLQGKNDFQQWISENGLPELTKNQNIVTYSNLNPYTSEDSYSRGEKQAQALFNIFGAFLNLGQGPTDNLNVPTISVPTSTPAPHPFVSPSSKKNGNKSNDVLGSNVYYGQCQSGDISLPDGCNLCQAGCGPTTAAMIASSYISKEYDPKKVVNLYDSKDYYLGCGGSSYVDAKSLFEDLGLKTTDYISFNGDTADEVASDFKKYIDGGWTLFTLANYCDAGCGHFFWVTDVDGKNNIYAYDPYYGQDEDPPINENDRYPFPKYRIAFGVKKG